MNAGQILDSLAGPVAMAGSTVVSAAWFPPDQRTTATAIVTRVQSLGGGLPFLLGPLVVDLSKYNISGNTTRYENNTSVVEGIRHDVSILLYIHLAIAGFLLLLVLVYFPSKPPAPPSVSAGLAQVPFSSGISRIVRMKNFWLLGMPYSLCYGVYIGWIAVLDVNLKPLGVSQIEAGWIGFYGNIAGFVSGITMARLADIYARRMKLFILILYTVSSLSFLFFALLCANIIPFWIPGLYICRVVGGASMNAMVGIVFETVCEAVYPITAAVANGTLTLIKNWWCFVFLVIFFIPNIGTFWINWATFGCAVLCIPVFAQYKSVYGRLDLDIPDSQKQPTKGTS